MHRAYDRLARLAHPSHAERLGLNRESLQLLFERATEAYITLGDSERRARYNFRAGIDPGSSLSEQERQQRRSSAARNAYERAQRLAAKEELHFAVELARQAAAMDPQPRYLALLGRLQSRNPRWFSDAVASYQRAIALAPDDPDLRLELAMRYQEKGDLQRARAICREILQHHPRHPRTEGLLAQLDDTLREPEKPPTTLDRLLGLFGGRAKKREERDRAR